jgi:acid phosphatase
VLVVEENQAFEDVIGSSAMPYLNSLVQGGALATQYYANAHPSISNYFQLTTGSMQTLDNNFPGPVSADNLAHELIAAGKSWKTYAEDLPSPGYLGGDVAHYIKHHNPFAYFSDVVSNPAQAANIVPFTQFAADLGAGALPVFSIVIPSAIDDGHDCPTVSPCTMNDVLTQADNWLKSNIAPLLSNAQFQRNGLLLITFDESKITDLRNGGGRVALIAAGPKARAGAQSTTFYQHENTLRTICDELNLSTCPGAAANARPETDLVQR